MTKETKFFDKELKHYMDYAIQVEPDQRTDYKRSYFKT